MKKTIENTAGSRTIEHFCCRLAGAMGAQDMVSCGLYQVCGDVVVMGGKQSFAVDVNI